MKMEILLEPTSNKLMVEHAEYDESNTYVLERFNTSAGNPVKKILLKLNLSDHRLLVFFTRLNKDSCVADMIYDEAWKNASEYVDNLSFLSKIEVPIIKNGEKYKIAWLDKNGIYDMMVCGLCMMNEESHDHLLFQYAYSKAIWLNLQGKMNCTINTQSWKDIVDLIAEKPCLNSIWSIIRRLSFGAVIYFLWQERNMRIFKDQKREWQSLLQIIYDTIKARVMGLMFKKSKAIETVAAL
ncbi:hypothetical protein Tco_0639856 [Tanacetum coccineum]